MKQQKDLISIVVLFHNLENYLADCLKSIQKQTYKNFEVIMVTNNVTDNSIKIANSFVAGDNRFCLIEYPSSTKNVAEIRNYALQKANGKYLAWVDGDDIVADNYLERLHGALVRDNHNMSMCSKTYSKNRNKRLGGKTKTPKVYSATKAQRLCLETNKYGGFLWNKLFVTEIAKKVGFEEDYPKCEDLLFVLKYLDHCKNVSYVNEKLYLYYKNVTGASINFKKLENGKKVIATCERIVEVAKNKPYYKNALLRLGLQSVEVILQNSKLLKLDEHKDIKTKLAINIKNAYVCFKKNKNLPFDYKLWQKVVIKLFYFKYKKYLPKESA